MAATSLFELKDALLETLEAKGILGELKAKVQAEISERQGRLMMSGTTIVTSRNRRQT